jgi:RimJ/RimL family protein N-acetyltransferase
VGIRALRAGDESQIRELLLGLDPLSWYFRFLSPYPTALDVLAPLLARVDDERGLTVIAEHPLSRVPRLVGIANIAFTGGGMAEVGLLITAAWQRQRLGTELAIRALRAAERRGISRFVGHMAAQNVAARRLLSRVGVVSSIRFAGRMSEYLFTARPETDQTPHRSGTS